jgi:hypothetical protein
VAKRENSKVETSQVVADAIAVKTMGDRIREASRCSHALRRGGSAVSVGSRNRKWQLRKRGVGGVPSRDWTRRQRRPGADLHNSE